MIRSINTRQMVAQTQSVLLSHAEIIRLVLCGLLEMLRG